MKKYLFPILCIIIITSSCNNNKKQVTLTTEDGKAVIVADIDKAAESVSDWQAKSAALQQLSPYTLDQLKAMIPEELAGGKRDKFSVNTYAGTSAATANYVINDSTKIDLNIFDCAGQAGAGIYNTQFLMAMNMQSETEKESVKTIELNGGKAIEQIRKDKSKASLTWLAGERLLVTVEGHNTGIDVLKQAAGSLSLK